MQGTKGDYTLEATIAAGDWYIAQTIADIPHKDELHHPSGKFVKSLWEYLEEKDYIILPTNKYLGCSIVTREWFMSQTQPLLNDAASYKKLSLESHCSYLRTKCDEITDLANQTSSKQLKRFFSQHLPDFSKGESRYDNIPYLCIKLPKFYAVPKVHKNPIKACPIALCHSALQNPVAKYLSKLLKPLIAKSKYIVNGTKEFTDNLQNVWLEPGQPFTIISDDIVTYYPNIPIDKMMEVMCLI